jgi:hypothetical protein
MNPGPSLLSAFKEYPLFMFGSGVFGFMGLSCLVVSLVMLRSRVALGLGAMAAVLGVLAMGSGVGGLFFVRSKTDIVLTIPGLSEHDKQRIVEYSDAQSNYQAMFGLGAGVIPLLGGVVLAALGRRRSTMAG